MAHPMKRDSSASQNAKMRKMTAGYGAADPKMNKAAGVDRYTQNGPQDDVGFGTDAEAPATRADRRARTTAANPLATYAKGGKVKRRARGGKVSGKGTHVNIIVAPQGAGPNAQPPLPPALANGPAVPPGAALPPMPPMGMGAKPPMTPPMMPPAGAMPPGIIPPRKRGGRVAARHDDAKEDMAMIKRVVKPNALKERARGGGVHMTAGAATGEGRLEKEMARARRKSGDKSAEI